MSTLTSNYLAPHSTPNGREEAWRFTPLKRLVGLHDLATEIPGALTFQLKNSVIDGVTFQNLSAAEIPPAFISNDLVTNRVRSAVTDVSIEIVPVVVIVPPDKPVPAATLVTVPAAPVAI